MAPKRAPALNLTSFPARALHRPKGCSHQPIPKHNDFSHQIARSPEAIAPIGHQPAPFLGHRPPIRLRDVRPCFQDGDEAPGRRGRRSHRDCPVPEPNDRLVPQPAAALRCHDWSALRADRLQPPGREPETPHPPPAPASMPRGISNRIAS